MIPIYHRAKPVCALISKSFVQVCVLYSIVDGAISLRLVMFGRKKFHYKRAMSSSKPYLTKSSYINGLACTKMLWLGWHEPVPHDLPEAGTPQSTGIEIGLLARQLYPRGVEISAMPWEHEAAVMQTREAMADVGVEAIFEAAFEFEDIRIRVDILERLGPDCWGLCEVKSSSSVKTEHLEDAALQQFVLKSLNLDLLSVSVLHVDTGYIRGDNGIDWNLFFSRKDVSDFTNARLMNIETAINSHKQTLGRAKAPEIEPGKHCPPNCRFWERCVSSKPDDWVFYLPRLTQNRFSELKAAGVESIAEIPEDFPLSETQTRIKSVLVDKRPYVSSDLLHALEALNGPCYYLDFEAASPAIPLFAGNRPYEQLPFQWSLHYVDGEGKLEHQEFLAAGDQDPRREFAESLVRAFNQTHEPVVVYSNFEQATVEKLATRFSDLREPLNRISARFVDLLEIVRKNVYLEEFRYSYSIKTVGPALVPGFSYDNIGDIKDGLAAAVAFQALATDRWDNPGAKSELKKNLLDYCRYDTLAMVKVVEALRGLIPNGNLQ